MNTKVAISQIRNFVNPEHEIPANIFEATYAGESAFYYLGDCPANIYMWASDSFEKITGYDRAELLKGNMEWWINCIHPEDIEHVYNMLSNFKYSAQLKYFYITYRFKKKDGEWIWVEEHKHLLSWENGMVGVVLCKVIDVTDKKLKAGASKHDTKSKMPLLDIVEKKLNSRKRNIENKKRITSALTTREKQILNLISQGKSTKMISEHLFISIHTVETHRTHLLKKLNAKNSMELIKESAEIFCL